MTTQTFERTPRQKELIRLLAGSARYCLAYGGSRSGKTFGMCDAIATRAIKAPGSRHAVFRRHGVAVKQSIGLDTMPKVINLKWPGLGAVWKDQNGYFQFPNGSEVWLAGLDDKDRVDKVLGREFSTLYFNEASEIPYSSYQVALTRLAQKVAQVDGRDLPQKVYVDLNPTAKAHWTYRLWVEGVEPEGQTDVDRDLYAYITMNPLDNRENLTADYIASLEAMPARRRKRFFDGEYASAAEGALWSPDLIQKNRVHKHAALRRIVVAIDPAITAKAESDETGIIAVGLGEDGLGYVLDDISGRYSPGDWAKRAIALFKRLGADRIVAEGNQGGEMVRHTLMTEWKAAPVTIVHASRGKAARAEPVAALYEQGRVKHVGGFPDLEDQLVTWEPLSGLGSPDRLDALVWALTDLMVDGSTYDTSMGWV